MPGLFNKKILKQRINNYSVDDLEEKINKIQNWQKNLADIQGLNEIELQNAFMRAIFEDILGYEDAPQKDKRTLKTQATTDVDATRPDGIIGFYDKTSRKKEDHRAVIELKGPQVPLEKDQKRKGSTYKSPVDQGFSYTNKLDRCRWVIVSNFTEIRLYQVGRSKEYYEIFYLHELDDIDVFKKFHYLLCKENLICEDGKSQTLQLTEATQKRHEDISVKFYNLYKDLRINLFEHFKSNNPEVNQEILLEKAQKFLDRIIFICFCEDKGLLPNDLLHEAIERGKKTFNPSETPIWDQIRGVFKAIDKGSNIHNINRYDGGLFKKDDILDNLIIDDDFFEIVYDVSDYDFDSDLDVNILGHIFEQSISDIEKLKSDIKDNDYDKSKSRRKKEGIYYTPQYITSYIVENAVGGYLEDVKEELGYNELPDIADANSKSWKTRYTKQHLEFYDKYEEKLKNIKILDPACGSGAFLNQAFDYLLTEHQWLNKQRDILKGGHMSIFSIESLQRNILKDNIFGVDLNEESVEITKLSLWLKTANKNKPLTNLDENIRCGNSLIDDPEVAGDKAFNWEEEFADIMGGGGFDVVIGNPPYVRAEKLGKQKEYYKDNFETYNYASDLFTYFYEKAIKLLKNHGYISFISNSFDKTKSGQSLRNFIANNTIIKRYIDLKNIKVFLDATTYPLIIVARKSNSSNNSNNNFIYKKINQKGLKGLDVSQESAKIIVQGSLDDENWVFISKEALDVKKKIENKGDLIKYRYNKIRRGLLTGLNEAFITEKDFNIGDHIKLIYEGRDIKKWITPKSEKKLILYKNGWTENKYGQKMDEQNYFNKMKKEFPKIMNYLEKFKDNAKTRYDKGEYWWELRNCSYYNEMEKDKIIFPNLQSDNKFSYDDKGTYINAPTVFFPCEDKSLLAILNSNLIWFYLKIICVVRNGGYIEVKPHYFEQIPIVDYSNKQKLLKEKAEEMIKYHEFLYKNEDLNFIELIEKYTSNKGNSIKNIITKSDFKNLIYLGRASKVRNFTVNINTNIATLYSEKSSNGKYELLKFEESNKYKRKYLKYYLENLTEEKLEEINDKYEGNLLEKVLQIGIPDYNKDLVVRKVVREWEDLQEKIKDLEKEIEKTDNEIDQMVYELYDLNDEEIKIVEESLSNK